VQYYGDAYLPYQATGSTPSAYQGGGPSYPAPPAPYLYNAQGQPVAVNPAYQQWWASLSPDQQAVAQHENDARNQQQTPTVTGAASGTTDPTQPDSSKWDTNGFAKPAFVVPPASRYAMPGWDNGKWNDPNHQSPKYVAGRILSTLAPTTANMDQATALLAKAYPGTTRVGAGDVNIPGVGVVDILMSAGTGGRGWWWGDAATVAQNDANNKAKATAGAPAGQDPMSQLAQALLKNPGIGAPANAGGYDIASNPQYQALQQQLAALTAQQQSWQQSQAQSAQQLADLQQKATTWQSEAQAAAKNRNNPSFQYY